MSRQHPSQSQAGLIWRSYNKVNWSHPLIILMATSIVGAGGWAAKEWYSSLDSSDLHVDLQHVQQAVKISGAQPQLLGEPIFCDTAAASLIIGHSTAGSRPITVNGIELVVEPIATDETDKISSSCELDPFGDRPYGIGERNVFSITLMPAMNTIRFIAGTKDTEAWNVPPGNLLSGAGHVKTITLKRDEEALSFALFISSQIKRTLKVSFRVSYDVAGEKTKVTRPIRILGEVR